MTNYETHYPTFAGTSIKGWEYPVQGEFHTDDLSEMANHFLLSASGFDNPDDYTDLHLPVVDTAGQLSLNGLWAAQEGPYSVEQLDIDLDEETKAEVHRLIDELGTDNFENFERTTVSETEVRTDGDRNPRRADLGSRTNPAVTSPPSVVPNASAGLIGLVFLVGATVALGWLQYSRQSSGTREHDSAEMP